MSAFAIWLFFGVVWSVVGAVELRKAFEHRALYGEYSGVWIVAIAWASAAFAFWWVFTICTHK